MMGSPTGDRPSAREVGRRCHVTLLFSDLCDFTSLSEVCDPEEVVSLLESAKDAAARIVERHGGTLNQFYGNGFLAVFGLPSPREDDVRHAVEAALELHEHIREAKFNFASRQEFPVRLHSGIHSGLVFASESEPHCGRYQLIGDAVNTAARLCSAASSDEILASEVSLRGVAAFFDTQAVTPLSLKGKEEPLAAFRVFGRSGVSTRFEARAQGGLTPFVGRTAELERLSVALGRVLAGDVQHVQLVGDAGVGKTRLMEEFRQRSASVRVSIYAGGCESYGAVVPLQPFRQIVRQIFGLRPDMSHDEATRSIEDGLSAIDPELSLHLGALLRMMSLGVATPGTDSGGVQRANSAGLIALVAALAKRQPLVLLLDDWQWADDASHEVLLALLSRLSQEPGPVLAVTASRHLAEGDPVSAGDAALQLKPFDGAEAARAVRALLSDVLDSAATDIILQRSGGNPLFLEELCQSFHEDLVRADQAPQSRSVPSTLRGLIQARVERLAPDLAAISRAAAVIGNEFELWLLERMVNRGELGAALEQLARSDLIYASNMPGAYRFKHGITREVVYEIVHLAERRRLHAEAAHAIEARFGEAGALEHCEALAHHYAGAADAGRALAYAELAGDKAATTCALDRARQQYGAAMMELDRISTTPAMRKRWLSLSRKWASACVYGPSVEQIQVLERALHHAEELGDHDSIARTHYWLAWIHYALGEQESALAHSQKALGLAERAGNRRLTAQLLANLGQIHAFAAECSLSLDCLEQAMGIKREHAKSPQLVSVPVGFAYAMGCKGVVHAYLGDFCEANRIVDAALDTVRGAGHAIEASLLGLRGVILVWQGRWEECVQSAQHMRTTAERVRGAYTFAMSQFFSGYARWMLTREPSALEDLTNAVEWLEKRQMRMFLSFTYAHQAEALASAGMFAPARTSAERALERCKRSDRMGEVTAELVLARCCLLDGDDRAGAREHLQRAMTTAVARRSPWEVARVELELGELEQCEGNSSEALEIVQQALAAFGPMGVVRHIERAELLRSRIAAAL
jgi:class 3 adenylate cyclase/tetratricopeptide (TPR) repeat protein